MENRGKSIVVSVEAHRRLKVWAARVGCSIGSLVEGYAQRVGEVGEPGTEYVGPPVTMVPMPASSWQKGPPIPPTSTTTFPPVQASSVAELVPSPDALTPETDGVFAQSFAARQPMLSRGTWAGPLSKAAQVGKKS